MWRNEFDPEDLKQICYCFDRAWNFVEHFAAGMFPEPALSREILAVQISGFAKQGETDKIRIVNFGPRASASSGAERPFAAARPGADRVRGIDQPIP